MINFKSARLAQVACLCLSMFVLALTAQAGEGDAAKKPEAEVKVDQVLPTLYSIKDAKTGTLRAMTDSERKAAGLPDLLARQSQLKPQTQKSGVVSIPLENTYQNAVLIKRNPDGSFSTSCVQSMEEARKFVATKAPSEADHAK